MTPFLSLALILVVSVSAAAQVRYRAVSIIVRDGRSLAADLYSSDTSVARPTILVQTPYNKNLYRLTAGLPPQAGGRSFPWDSAHYNVVVVDWRGFYGSRDAAVAGYDRGLDGYDVVEWIARQPWSDGRVGMWGPSALGHIQFLTARHRPPHLLCAVPLVKDFLTKYTDYYYGGEYRREHVETLSTLGFVSPETILSRPTYDLLWQTVERNSDLADEIAIPMLVIGGWYDHYPDDVIRAFEDLRARSDAAVRGEHRLVMGPWLHSGIGGVEQGALAYPTAAALPDSLTLAFFDRHLRAIDNGFEAQPPVRYFQMGDDEWRSATSWSDVARASDTLALNLAADGSLTRTTSAEGVVGTFASDPRDPAPSVGGSRFPQPGTSVPIGPQDQREVESRGDVIVYETPVLTDDLVVTGAPYVELFASATTPDADIAVRLSDVHPDGRSMLVTQGIQRLRFRRGARPQDTAAMTPGTVERVRVRLQNMAMTWRAGHRVRIALSGAAWPHFEANPNTGGPLYGGTDTAVATIALHGGASSSSRLVLPVAPSTSGIGEESVPRPGRLHVTPHPLHGDATIGFEVSTPGHVTLVVRDLLGRHVATLVDDVLEAGAHRVTIDVDEFPRAAYLLEFRAGGQIASRIIVP